MKILFDRLIASVDEVYGPQVKQGAITLAKMESFSDLPQGYIDKQSAGSYSLQKTSKASFFGYAVGPHSVKNILHPPQRKLWSAQRQEQSFQMTMEDMKPKKLALFGIRSCDVEAIHILDQVFLNNDYVDQHYKALRDGLLLITATCSKPSSLCFCTSMGHGPKAKNFDINISEIIEDHCHVFIAEAGSDRGWALLECVNTELASANDARIAEQQVQESIQKIEKTLDTRGLPEFLEANRNHSQWQDVAERCLSCANCTMVCPTCFCTTTFDSTDLEGDHSERWLQWDSCFTSDFSYIHGGTVRASTKSRYRQWLTHKLSSWHQQFGTSGCVGCGRCIAWCPVKIDITEEVKNLRQATVSLHSQLPPPKGGGL